MSTYFKLTFKSRIQVAVGFKDFLFSIKLSNTFRLRFLNRMKATIMIMNDYTDTIVNVSFVRVGWFVWDRKSTVRAQKTSSD